MSLDLRAKLVYVSTLIGLTVVLYITLRAFLLPSFSQVEAQATKRNVERLLSTVADNAAQLSSANADYAFWDDTYSFIEWFNDYYTSHFTYDGLENLGVNVMVWINLRGEIVFHQSVDFETMAVQPLPQGLASYLQSGSPLIPSAAHPTAVQGFILTDDSPMLVTSQPILNSDQQGPAKGTLVFGRYLDRRYVQYLSEALRGEVSLKRLDDPQLTATDAEAISQISSENPVITQPEDETRIHGYTILDDISGNPAIMLRITMPRDIYAEGQGAVAVFFVALLIVGLVFTSTASLLLHFTVLKPIARLSERISYIRSRADLNERIIMPGRDELANLAANMNGMLDALAKAQQALEAANEELETRVEERTAELSQANDLLKREVAARERTQIELAQARDQALEALRLKAQILANISHDARTPLTIIMLRTEMMQKERYGPVTERQKDTLDSLMLNARQLLTFIDNLLNEAQMKADRLKLKDVPFAPEELLQTISAAMSPLAENKGLNLKTELADDMPAAVRGDPEKLAQILTNLVENAIRFTKHGTVTVRILKIDAQHWALEVTDTGSGIPAEAQAHIFDAFWQVDGSSTREVNQGVGLGLSIVRQLVMLMGGQTTLSSQVGQGSTFTLTFPLYTAEVKPS